jgi:hypothetical protein
MHASVSDQHRWLFQVLRGHYMYFGLSSNFRSLTAFYREVRLPWFRALRRRSQRSMSWEAYRLLLESFSLPVPRITHPCVA